MRVSQLLTAPSCPVALNMTATNDKDLPRKRKKLDEAMVKTAQEFAGTVRMRTGVLTAGLM